MLSMHIQEVTCTLLYTSRFHGKNIFIMFSNHALFRFLKTAFYSNDFLTINGTYHQHRRPFVSAFSHLSNEAWHLASLCDFLGCEGLSAVTSMWQWQTAGSTVDSFHLRGHFCPLIDDSWLWRWAQVPWSVLRTRLRQNIRNRLD